MRQDVTRYDRVVRALWADPRLRRLIVLPLVVLVSVSGAAFALAKLHLAKPGVPKAAAGTQIELGDAYRGETIFSQTCAGCHGAGGSGGGIGPKLRGNPISLAAAKARIDGGGGVMPARLVSGRQEADVLAYVATILAPSS